MLYIYIYIYIVKTIINISFTQLIYYNKFIILTYASLTFLCEIINVYNVTIHLYIYVMIRGC